MAKKYTLVTEGVLLNVINRVIYLCTKYISGVESNQNNIERTSFGQLFEIFLVGCELVTGIFLQSVMLLGHVRLIHFHIILYVKWNLTQFVTRGNDMSVVLFNGVWKVFSLVVPLAFGVFPSSGSMFGVDLARRFNVAKMHFLSEVKLGSMWSAVALPCLKDCKCILCLFERIFADQFAGLKQIVAYSCPTLPTQL